MNFKQKAGLISVIVGIVLIFFGIDALQKIAEARGFLNDVENFFTHNPGWNPIIEFFGGSGEEELSKSNTSAVLVLILGIGLVIAGAVAFIKHKKGKKS